jgi:hypothetical protein
VIPVKTVRLLGALMVGIALFILPGNTSQAAGQIPAITSVVISSIYGTFPAAGNNGTTTTITINGANLLGVNLPGVAAVTVYLGSTVDPLISTTNIVPSSTTPDTSFKVDIVVASAAAAGARNITVTTPFGTSPVATGVFSVYRATVNAGSTSGVSPGATFDVYINVNNVATIDSYQFDLIYDPSVINVVGDEGGAGVSAGLMGQVIFPVDMWGFFPAGTPGQVRSLGNLPGVSGICGSGYLAKITFEVTGAIGTSSPLTLPGADFLMWDHNASLIIPDSVSDSTVNVTALSINTTSMADGTQGVAYSNSINATSGIAPYTWSATGLPGGLSINSSTGTVSGTPTVSGDFTVTISVKDSASPVQNSVSRVFNLRIYSALQITTAALPETVANVSYPSTIIAFTGGKGPYILNATGLPAGISLNTSTGVISGSTVLAGSFNVIFTVSDSFLPANNANKTLTLKVYDVLQITTATLPSGLQGNNYSANITAGGGKTPYTWSASGLPAGLTINASTGIISGTPSTSGDFTINITALDSFSPANISSVNPVLHIGQGVSILTTVLPDATQNINYPASALNAAGGISPYTWNASGLPAGLNLSTAGVITGMPTTVGSYTVVISVRDSSVTPLTQTATFNIKVYSPLSITTSSLLRWDTEVFPASPPANWLPLPAPGWIAGQAYSATLIAAGGKPNYTWSASGLPPGMSISTGGVISGIPATSGLFNITFMVQDSISPANFASKLLTLKIYKAGDADGDGQVTMGDVTIVERVMLGLNPPTAGCDSNLNKVISIGDCTVIERIILGIQ